ncbi:MAG: sensor histidine kinase [Thermosynechococcaceae cyanobacterium]
MFDSSIPFRIGPLPLAAYLQGLIGNNGMVRLKYPSFRFLLYLEWMLLGTAVLLESLHLFESPNALLFRSLEIALFGLMGLRLPVTARLRTKIGFTTLEFGLILLPDAQGEILSSSGFLLFLVLLMRSCLIFHQIGRVVVLGLALVSYSTLVVSRPIIPAKIIATTWEWRLSHLLLFGLTLVFALLLINALFAERKSREQLEDVHEQLAKSYVQLRQYALRIEDQATLKERNRIAREIHDGLGHTLSAQTIQINNAILFWNSDPEQSFSFLKQAKQQGSNALLEIRRSVSVLRSNPLQDQSLENALGKLLNDFQRVTGIDTVYDFQPDISLNPEVNTSLYRIVQEALTNIQKHAQASTVRVEISHYARLVYLTIDDDGQGFDPIHNTTGFGLKGIRERVADLGGQLILKSQIGQGCRISVSLPLSM